MVRLSKIYTKVGDAGRTMLGDGSMTAKDDVRVEAYGAVDEANASIGLAIVALTEPAATHSDLLVLRDELIRVQHDLFDVGADLCVPLESGEAPGSRLRVQPAQTQRLERVIDSLNERLKPLDSFVLPGGRPAAASLHMARATVRRAERRASTLLQAQPDRTNPATLVFLNRLSDLLFVMARVVNDDGLGDVLWKPGANRDASEQDSSA